MDLHPGAVIAGRYRLERKIGVGGMGEVWAGEHVAIGVKVALKTLLPAAALDQQVVARFRREAYLLGRLRSDRVARVVDFVEDRRFGLVLVMDYVEGEPLATVLESRCLSIEETIDLAVDIMTAVCDLHRAKVVHRDLKPDNIILEPIAAGRKRAVIVDFGVSRMETSHGEEGRGDDVLDELTGITQADVAVGTIPYMAPEQFLSSRDVNGSADVYAVGAILFRAVAGQHVYGNSEDLDYAKLKLTTRAPPLSLGRFDRVAHGLRSVVARALERSPDARFDSAESMLAELVALQDVARAQALDLEAATEQAMPPSSTASLAAEGEEASEMTRRMSRPPGLVDEIFDERTLDSPMVIPGDSSHPPASTAAPASSLRTTVAPPTVGARPTVPSPGMVPLAPSAPPAPPSAPVSAPAPTVNEPAPLSASRPVISPARAISARALVLGMVAALLVGVLLGFEGHRLFGG
jgi:serine/threonine-protein kinase